MHLFDTELFNQRLFYPRPDHTPPGPTVVDHFVEVPGARIHLRQHTTPGATPVLHFNGNGEVVADYDKAAPKFARAGAELWVADYRGYGLSTGVPTLRNFISDSRLVAAHLGRPFVVFGRSLGSAGAAELMGLASPQLRGVVIDSGASDFTGLIRRREMEVPDTFSPEIRAVFDPLPKMKRGTAPLLVMHGLNDAVIHHREATLAFETAGTPASQKTLCLIEGHGHNDVGTSPKYWEALRAFLLAHH